MHPRRIILALSLWTASLINLTADQLTYRITGTVQAERTSGRFTAGRPYTFTFTVDTSVAKNPATPEYGTYRNAVTSFDFNYDSGSYTAGGPSDGTVIIWNNERGLYDHFQMGGLQDFPPVNGQAFSSFVFTLSDTSAIAFASTDLPSVLKKDAFQLRQFQIGWGIDFNLRTLFLDIETIEPARRRPEIVSTAREPQGLTLTIELPDAPSTNILERADLLSGTNQWETVASFITTNHVSHATNWFIPLQPNVPAQFFRMRPR